MRKNISDPVSDPIAIYDIMSHYKKNIFQKKKNNTVKSLPKIVSEPAIGGVWLETPKLLEPEWSPVG